jgi:hypothetical protein
MSAFVSNRAWIPKLPFDPKASRKVEIEMKIPPFGGMYN